MGWIKVVAAAFFTLIPTAAQAETWRHAQSGVSVDIPANLRVGEVRDMRGDGTDVLVQLGGGVTIVTFFVYRAAYPNAALWYERARQALNHNFNLSSAPDPRRFALTGAGPEDGLREEIDLGGAQPRAAPGTQIRATAVAIAGHGEWLIKVRISSSELGRAEVSQMMDSVLGGVRLSSPATSRSALALPGPCPAGLAFNGRSASLSGGASASAGLQALEAAVRGRSGLAAEPAAWCRLQTTLPANTITLYARRDGGGWVALVGDAGAAMTTLRPAGGNQGPAVLYGSTTSGNRLLFTYDGVPPPTPEVERGIQPTMEISGNAT